MWKLTIGFVAAFGLIASGAAAQESRLVTVTGCLQSQSDSEHPLMLKAQAPVAAPAEHNMPAGHNMPADHNMAGGHMMQPTAMQLPAGDTVDATAEADVNLQPYLGHVIEATGFAMPFAAANGADRQHWHMMIGTMKVVGGTCGGTR
jgi:hypothetical protein